MLFVLLYREISAVKGGHFNRSFILKNPTCGEIFALVLRFIILYSVRRLFIMILSHAHGSSGDTARQ